jgi:phage-related protein (TIGR01555 family)
MVAADLVLGRPADPYRRDLQLPVLPPCVESPEMAMDDAGGYPMSSYLNTVGGALAFGLYFPGYPWLAELAQRSEFRQPTETTARELTRKWITFKSKGEGDKSKKIKQIEDAFTRMKVQQVFREAAMHDGFYGVGHVFVDIKGQETDEDRKLPLLLTPQTVKKGALRGFRNIEPMWCTPIVWNSQDPTLPHFYKPTSWMVLGRPVNSTRLMQFISREVPDIIKPAYNFGGISLTQLIQPYVDRWLKTVDSVNRLIANFSVIFLQTDMTAALQAADNSGLLARVRNFTKLRDNQGIFLTDKETEMLAQLAVPLSGLSELQAQAQEHMAAPTHLPLVVLTGITPAGLNSSSEGEIQVFHEYIHATQETLFKNHLDKVLCLVQLSEFGAIDEDIIYEFEPMQELQGKAAAEVYKTKAEAGTAYINAGVIAPEEERERLARDPDSGYVNLDVNKIPTPPDQALLELSAAQSDNTVDE